MPKYESNDLRTKRASLIEQNRALLDTAISEKRDNTAEELSEFEARDGEIKGVEAQISVMETAEGYAPEQRAATINAVQAEEVAAETEQRDMNPLASDEYREAFNAYMENPFDMDARAALKVGGNAEGGYTVAQDWNEQLVISLREFGVMRLLSQVITTEHNGEFHVPALETYGSAALTGETEAFSESEPTFKTIALKAYKITELIKVTDEMLQDSIFDIPAFVQQVAAQNVSKKENALFVAGTGSSQPKGITVAASVGITAASSTVIKADELLGLYHSVVTGYRNNASFVMNDSTVLAIRKLKDTQERYLWQPALNAGDPDTFSGRPVYSDPDFPTMATGQVSVVFGDFSGYWIRDVLGTEVRFLDQTYAAEGLTAFRVARRSDGNLIDTSAVKSLKHP